MSVTSRGMASLENLTHLQRKSLCKKMLFWLQSSFLSVVEFGKLGMVKAIVVYFTNSIFLSNGLVVNSDETFSSFYLHSHHICFKEYIV